MNGRLLHCLLLMVALSALFLGACGPATTTGDEVGLSNPLGVRDAVLAYLAGQFGEQGPAPDLSWKERRTAVVLGKTKVEYEADTDRTSGENPGILRGEQELFRGQDAEPPFEFETMIGDLLASAEDRP